MVVAPKKCVQVSYDRRRLTLTLAANNICYVFIFAVHQRYVLTAAHCVAQDSDHENGNAFYILVGDHDITTGADTKYSQLYYVEEVRRHQQFDQAGFENDIALLRTTEEIVWSRAVGPLCLPFSFLYVLIMSLHFFSLAPTNQTLDSQCTHLIYFLF